MKHTAIFALALCGCAADAIDEPVDTASTSSALLDDSIAEAPSVDLPSLTEESAAKALHADVVAEVDWQAAIAHDRVSVADAPDVNPETITGAAIPTLVPSDATLLASTRVYAGADWVSARHENDDYVAIVFGTRRAFSYPHLEIEEEDRIAEGRPLITRSEGIPYVSFTRFGVAYRLSVECFGGPSDPNCAEVDTLHELFESLAVLDGGDQ